VTSSRSFSVYLARCADGTLYCGIARDVQARIAEHDAGRGARYTRGRGPLTVLLVRRCRDVGLALRIERAVKRLPRAEKLALAEAPKRLAALARAASAQWKRSLASQRGSGRHSTRALRSG
jgi:putative endonuclease